MLWRLLSHLLELDIRGCLGSIFALNEAFLYNFTLTTPLSATYLLVAQSQPRSYAIQTNDGKSLLDSGESYEVMSANEARFMQTLRGSDSCVRGFFCGRTTHGKNVHFQKWGSDITHAIVANEARIPRGMSTLWGSDFKTVDRLPCQNMAMCRARLLFWRGRNRARHLAAACLKIILAQKIILTTPTHLIG